MPETGYLILSVDMFYFEKINNKKILKSDFLDKSGFLHFFTTRDTVIRSQEAGFEQIVDENKKDICKFLNIDENNLISPSQTHTSNVQTAIEGNSAYPDTDALILSNFSQAIYLNFADCTPIIFYDEEKHIAAIAHAGWRGTAEKIGPKTVEKMVKEFGSKPENIIAAIGPAISDCCYEIGEDVYNRLKNTLDGDTTGCFTEKNGKKYAELKNINCRQLLACGLKKIDICNYCTSCANELFFSYRKENGTTNRHSAIIKINER